MKDLLKEHWLKLVLPAILVPVIAYPIYDQYKSKKFEDDVGRRLTSLEQTVKEYGDNNPTSRLENWLNKNLEIVKQFKEKLKKGKLSSSEMRELIASIKDILSHIKSILNFLCSFGSAEDKDALQILFDKTTEEIERTTSKPSIELEDEETQHKISELLDNLQEIFSALRKFCVFQPQER